MVIGRKLGDGFRKLVSFGIIQLHWTSALRHGVTFYTARKGPYIKSGDSMKQQTSQCVGRGSFIWRGGEKGDTDTPVPLVAIQQKYSNGTTNDKKSLPRTGIDPMPLAFKAGVLACFRGKWYRTHVTCFQGNCHVHCTSTGSATLHYGLVRDASDGESDENETSVSNQARHVL